MNALRRLLPVAFVVAAVAAALLAVARDAHTFTTSMAQIGPLNGLLSLGAAVLGLVSTFAMWRCLLAGVGQLPNRRVAARMFFVSQLGKYLPGSVWPAVAQMEFGRRHGLDRRAVLAANLLALVWGVATGAITAAGMIAIRDMSARPLLLGFVVVSGVLLVGSPRLVLAGINLLLRLVRKPSLDIAISRLRLIEAAGWGVLAWAFFGLHLFALVRAHGGGGWDGLALATGAFALAASAGILVLPAPAGVGIRDAVLVAVLSATVGPAPALAAGLTSRFIMTIADLVSAVIGSRLRLEKRT